MNELVDPKNLEVADVEGSGGGGGKGGGNGGGGTEAGNTLRSTARARLLELISEGEVESVLVNGGGSIYFDQTPVVNQNNTVNFKGIQWESRNGLPDQTHFLGNASAETPFQVETRVKASTGPLVRTISEQNATAVRVVVRVPSLADANNDKGNINPTSVSWQIEVRPNNGAWAVAGTVNLTNQKCTSAYERATRVELPAGGFPWDLRVTRLTPDSTSAKIQNETYWASYTTIVEGRFVYPNCALVYVNVDASLFNQSSIPTRFFHVKGVKLHVPTNYDPVTRAYTGIWNGTFKIAYSNNPAWVLYDLLINDRYGIGEFVDATRIDKWSLYQIAQYCDQLVPNGFGAMEPRYTFNAQLNTREEAFKVLQTITTAFRGMCYWSLGQVYAVPDAPSDPIKLVTPANVVEGHFTYTGTALKARHSVAVVTWNDPQDFYRPAKEVVVNEAQVRQYGWRETQVQAFGCTSRGLAHRYGRWILDTEQNATETVEYTASWDHAEIRPGDIIAVADPRKASIRTGGRLKETGASVLTLDAPFVPTGGVTYTLMTELPDGSVAQRVISSFSGDNTVITLASALDVTPVVGAMWIITGSDVAPRQYRVLSISETEKHLFKINALFHDPTKYARVEQDLQLDPISYTRPKTTINPPSNVEGHEELYFLNGVQASRILMSWTPGDDFMARGYRISADGPQGFVMFPEVLVPAFTLENAALGEWKFYVSSISKAGLTSPPVEVIVTALGWQGVAAPEVQGLSVFGRTDSTFLGQNCRIVWRNVFHNTTTPGEVVTDSAGGITNPFYMSNEVRVYDYDTDTLLRTETVGVNEYTYTFNKNSSDNVGNPKRHLKFTVTVKDTLGRTSAPMTISPQNLAPLTITPVLTAGLEQIFLTFDTPTDLDYRGAKVWLSTVNGFDPLVTTPVYEGPNSALSFPVTPDTPYYVRIAGYDEFGRTGLNISAQQEITASSIGADLSPPSVPAGLALASAVSTRSDGTVVTTVTATWDAVGSGNLDHYDIQIQQGDGSAANWISNLTDTNRYSWDVAPSTQYAVRVRSVSKSGYPSAFATIVTATSAAKTAAPNAPTGLAVTASLKSAYLSWVNPSDADLAQTEIFRNTSNDSGTATKIGSSRGIAFTVAGLTTGTTYYFWVKATNTSGLTSGFSSGVSVVPGQVAEGDIAANAITADKIVAGTITGEKLNINTSLPASITVGATGVTIGAIQTQAVDGTTALNKFSGPGGTLPPTAVSFNYAGSSSQGGAATDSNALGGTSASTVVSGAASGTTALSKFSGAGSTLPSGQVEFNFATSTSKGGNATNVDAVGTQPAATVQSAVVNFNANNDRFSVTPDTPSIALDGTCVDHTINTDGSAEISFEWGYTTSTSNDANNIDGFIVYVRASTSSLSYTFNPVSPAADEQVYYLTPERRAFVLSGAAANLHYSFAVQAYRIVDTDVNSSGVLKSSVAKSTYVGENPYQPATSVAFAGDITGTIAGTTASTVVSNAALGAQDPGSRINSGSTTIDPGKILISGSTYLSNWRNGSDNTKIEGGSIAANTVTANKIIIGSRNLQVVGIEFTYDKTTSVLSWTSGSIGYTNDAGNMASVSISAGSISWTSGTVYVAWAKDATTLVAGTTPYSDATHVTFATYQGSNILVANYGRTIIDGAKIITGSVTANQIAAGTITANELAADSIVASKIAALAVSAEKIQGGTLNATSAINIGGTSFQLSAPNQNMIVTDGTYNRVKIGGLGSGNFGIEIRDAANNIILSSGSGVPSSAVSGLGAFATLGQITSGNISTYIASAAIGTTQIGDAQITTAKIGDLQVNTLKIQDNAVIIPISFFNSTSITGQAPNNVVTMLQVATLTFTLDQAAFCHIVFNAIQDYGSASDVYTLTSMVVNGTGVNNTGSRLSVADQSITMTYAPATKLAAGTHTVTVNWGASANVVIKNRSLLVLAVKK